MGTERSTSPGGGVPADYPGRVVDVPAGVTHIVYGIYGIQTRDAGRAAGFIVALLAHCAIVDGPQHIERLFFRDAAGYDSSLVLAYWTDRAAHARWWAAPAVSRWWAAHAHAMDGETGYWREVMAPAAARFQFAAGTEDRAGSAAVMPLKPCATFGYWGAYRDRLPASHHDAFKSPLATPPQPRLQATRGRRLSLVVPDNLCFIREGQGWGDCGAEEKRIWDEEMAANVDSWVAFLAADPVATGCLSIRSCSEHALASGAPTPRQSQLAFLLSLAHIEQAARTQPTHLAVHDSFIRMYTEPRFTPRMHVWVEVLIVKHDELVTEYIDCHPQTGLLPFFPAHDLAGW